MSSPYPADAGPDFGEPVPGAARPAPSAPLSNAELHSLLRRTQHELHELEQSLRWQPDDEEHLYTLMDRRLRAEQLRERAAHLASRLSAHEPSSRDTASAPLTPEEQTRIDELLRNEGIDTTPVFIDEEETVLATDDVRSGDPVFNTEPDR